MDFSVIFVHLLMCDDMSVMGGPVDINRISISGSPNNNFVQPHRTC